MEDDGDQSFVELIDDEFEDDLHNKSLDLLADTSVIDDIFGTDTLMSDFNNLNDVIMRDPENIGNPGREIITCPICQDKLPREDLSEHLEGCGGIKVEVKRKGAGKAVPYYRQKKKPPAAPSRASQPNSTMSREDEERLMSAGYSLEDLRRLQMEQQEEESYNKRIFNELADEERDQRAGGSRPREPQPSTSRDGIGDGAIEILQDLQACPVCNSMVPAEEMNSHLDVCLQSANDFDDDD